MYIYVDVRGPSGLLEYTCKGTFAIKADKKSEPKQVPRILSIILQINYIIT